MPGFLICRLQIDESMDKMPQSAFDEGIENIPG